MMLRCVHDRSNKQEKRIRPFLIRREGTGEEALALLDRSFPRLEAHLGQMKKYQATINYLTQENTGLKEKAAQNSVRRRLEAEPLKRENERLRELVARIPPEIREELQARHMPQKRREERE